MSSRLTAVCERVSSADQRDDLDRQVARVGAGLHERLFDRPGGDRGRSRAEPQASKVLGLVSVPQVTTILVEHRDRFARFGSEYVAASFKASGRRFAVVDDAEVDDDLVRDMTEVLTSFCARPAAAGGRASGGKGPAAAGEDDDAA